MRRLLAAIGIAVSAAGIAPTGAASAQAVGPQDYIHTLEHGYGWIIWDYPLAVRQGHIACGMLWDDINPYGWLTQTVGYSPKGASEVIAAARVNLCPGNAVTR